MTQGTLRTVDALVRAGLATEASRDELEAVAARYAVAITQPVAELIARGDDADPIARQYVPDPRELLATEGDLADPIGDRRHMPVEGIVHRYPDRVLFKVVHVCPVYCRFCFRREMVGPGREANLSPQAIGRARDYIAANSGIHEVIFTGGDPLVLAPHRVAQLTQMMDAIGHVERIRWHTRMPVVDPARIDTPMAQAIKPRRAQLVIALHANHPAEFTKAAGEALRRLHAAGARLLSQSVLLRGINDSIPTLAALLDTFRAHSITPYYLHHADLAPGTAHFRTSIRHGIGLMQALRAQAPGTALPDYVLDIPGGYSKVILTGDDAVETRPGQWRLRDDAGQWHDYAERL
ncbi:MAG: lysine-2,3-aminomutase-like protein [Alphaproteobacteria bacterium]|nr:lysine-2,3-aminomutase-like protein [Alphaproteobacteria bacterium]